MKFLLDESADYPLATYLRALGHDITAIGHDYPHALEDREVLAIAHPNSVFLSQMIGTSVSSSSARGSRTAASSSSA